MKKRNKRIDTRVLDVSNYLASHKCTVRFVANVFNISKSTVHSDIKYRLPELNKTLYNECRAVLDYNKSVRHIRGGQATAKKYSELRNAKGK